MPLTAEKTSIKTTDAYLKQELDNLRSCLKADAKNSFPTDDQITQFAITDTTSNFIEFADFLKTTLRSVEVPSIDLALQSLFNICRHIHKLNGNDEFWNQPLGPVNLIIGLKNSICSISCKAGAEAINLQPEILASFGELKELAQAIRKELIQLERGYAISDAKSRLSLFQAQTSGLDTILTLMTANPASEEILEQLKKASEPLRLEANALRTAQSQTQPVSNNLLEDPRIAGSEHLKQLLKKRSQLLEVTPNLAQINKDSLNASTFLARVAPQTWIDLIQTFEFPGISALWRGELVRRIQAIRNHPKDENGLSAWVESENYPGYKSDLSKINYAFYLLEQSIVEAITKVAGGPATKAKEFLDSTKIGKAVTVWLVNNAQEWEQRFIEESNIKLAKPPMADA